MFLNSQILTSHPKSSRLLDSTPMFQQFPCRSPSTTRRPILHRRPHLNLDGSLLLTVHWRSPSPTSNTEMDFNQINKDNNRIILPITGTTANTPPFYSSAMAHPNFYSNVEFRDLINRAKTKLTQAIRHIRYLVRENGSSEC